MPLYPPVAAAARLLAHSETDGTQDNSTAEFNIVNTTIAAGTLAVGDSIRLHARAMVFNGSALGVTVRWRLYLAGTVIADTGATDTAGASGSRWRPWRLDSVISLISLTQIWHRSDLVGINTDPATETAWMPIVSGGSAAGVHRLASIETIAVSGLNFANATALRFTGTLGTAAAGAQLRTNGFTLERLFN